MAELIIERVLDKVFEFTYESEDPIRDDSPTVTSFGDVFHFKTNNGANIIRKQNVLYSEITIVDTYGGTGTFTDFPNTHSVWSKLSDVNYLTGSSGSGGGVDRFIHLLDGFSFNGQDGKVPVVDESQLKLVPSVFYNINEFTQLDDVAVETLTDNKYLKVELVEGVPKIVLSDVELDQDEYFSAVGGFDYSDLATQTTPLSYTTGDLQLTNDIEGDNTFLSQPPYGITSVWNDLTNTFDWNELSVGDEVFIRIHIGLTTTAVDQISELKLLFGEGSSNEEYMYVDSNIYIKDIGTTEIIREFKFYIGNEDWRTIPTKLLFSSDNNADIRIYGWHPYIIRKSVNILDVNDDNFKTLQIDEITDSLTQIPVNNGFVKFGYNSANDKLNLILFDSEFTKYLESYDLTGKDIYLNAQNKGSKNTLVAEITSLGTYIDTGKTYFALGLEETIDLVDISINDKIEFNFNVSNEGGSGDSSPLTTKGDIYTYDTDNQRLPVGTNGQVLSANSAEPTGLEWIDNTSGTTVSDKEDFIATAGQTVFNLSDTPDNVDVVVNQIIQLEGTQYVYSSGVVTFQVGYELDLNDEVTVRKFFIGGDGSDVTSVFGRTGAVVSESGDYDSSQINFSPYLTITSTDNQSAIEELKDELDVVDDNINKGLLIEDASVSVSYDIDWNNDTWYITLTGNTTFTESNLPLSGTNTKVITLDITGDFSLTFPTGWTDNLIGSYDGLVRNQLVIEFIKTGEYWLTINQPD